MAEDEVPPAEFSRLVPRHRLGGRDVTLSISANDAEREALAARFGWLSLGSLEAEVRLRRKGKGSLVELSGHLRAAVVQACVVTLEPVREQVDERFAVLYTLDGSGPLEESEVVFRHDEEEPPEPVGADGIDVGEAVVQQLSVAVEPFPRAAGAQLEREGWGESEGGEARSPFAVLERLKRDS